ncbi:MAG: hypothetical protein KAI25_00240 [Hyphomicrobiaceae bacterium]|nr:hypothetical protein [Hyphomicrobiaceae bacterium]
MDREFLEKESRWGEILGKNDLHRANEFIELFGESLARYHQGDGPPLRTEIVAARAFAQTVWAFDRETSDGKWIRELVDGNRSLIDAREKQFATLQHQFRGRNLILQGLAQIDEFVDGVRDVVSGNVVPLPARKVRSA